MDKLEKKDPMNDVDNPFKVFFPSILWFHFSVKRKWELIRAKVLLMQSKNNK